MLESYIVATVTKDSGMGKTVFIPLTDDFLYEYPERIIGPVIPFSQHARRPSVQSGAFSSTTHDLDTKANFESTGAIPASRSKWANTSLLRVGTLR